MNKSIGSVTLQNKVYHVKWDNDTQKVSIEYQQSWLQLQGIASKKEKALEMATEFVNKLLPDLPDSSNNMIPIDGEIERFYHHLSYNDRVIFSAKFGDGKSFFLNQFFEKYQNKFCCIKVYPVNYQVESNNDIFELIKKDILIQLLANDLIVNDDELIDDSLYAQYYLFNNGSDIILDLLSAVPVIDTPVKILQKAIGHIRKFRQSKKNIQQKPTDPVEEYLRNFTISKGVCEYDNFSELITRCVNRIKKNRKKVILLVEDMDRIDPSHIFRILNILTAHMERLNVLPSEGECNQQNNKFNFDKIITVCHYENIENIFHHFYGPKTDFEGYIRKFTTHNPFRYSIKELCKIYIRSKIKDPHLTEFSYYFDVLTEELLASKKYSIRDICNNFNNDFPDIIDKKIGPKKYSTKNPFMKFLALAQRFRMDTDSLLLKVKDQGSNLFSFYSFIGINWLFLDDNGVVLTKSGKQMKVVISGTIAMPKVTPVPVDGCNHEELYQKILAVKECCLKQLVDRDIYKY